MTFECAAVSGPTPEIKPVILKRFSPPWVIWIKRQADWMRGYVGDFKVSFPPRSIGL